jgi:hypothetical protein
MYERTEDHHEGPLTITVRIWHDPAYGMSAEPLCYRIDGGYRIKFGQNVVADQIVKRFVEECYTEVTLEHIMHNDPTFEGVPFMEPPISVDYFRRSVL